MILSRFRKFVRRLPAKAGCFAVCALLAGCGQASNKTGQPKSPFAQLLPKDPPDEKYRVTHPAGYSIVFPAGWKTKVTDSQGSQQWVDGLSTDRRGVSGADDSTKPSLHISRCSKEGKKAVQGGGWFKDMKPIQFQNQPAWSKFEPGRLPAKFSLKSFYGNVAGYPYLTQELLFERNGEWFRLSFHMRNIKGRKGPYFTEPPPIVEKYFETFKYEPASNH